LLLRLAAHTRHLEADPRLSLLLAQTGAGDPLTHPRARFLAKHPKSALYADFSRLFIFAWQWMTRDRDR
jgi:heme iron utilization protein